MVLLAKLALLTQSLPLFEVPASLYLSSRSVLLKQRVLLKQYIPLLETSCVVSMALFEIMASALDSASGYVLSFEALTRLKARAIVKTTAELS